MSKSRLPNPKIVASPQKMIVGLKINMSLSEDRTASLWKKFVPLRKSVSNPMDGGSYSVQVYDTLLGDEPFLPTTIFEKWAGIRVKEVKELPEDFEVLIIPAGDWAVFQYQGLARDFGKFMNSIVSEWLPSSPYDLEDRPHFEYMPEDYLGPNNPLSVEQVWIPVKGK